MKKYKKEDLYSYTLGTFPTLELIKHQPQLVNKIIYSAKLANKSAKNDINYFCKQHKVASEINDKALSIISEKENCFVAGVFKKIDTRLAAKQPHIVLVAPENMGNAGTILRTVLGFGYTNVAIIKPGVDIYNPKVVRASMGAIFSMNVSYFNSFEDYQKQFPDHKIYTFMLKGRQELQSVKHDKQELYSLVFGSESSGLPDSFLEKGTSIIIKHSDRIDSLNLTIAVAIASYVFSNGD